MSSKTLTSKFSTVAVIACAVGLALIQGKAFAEANDVDTPAGITQPEAANDSNSAANSPAPEVQTFDVPGGGNGGEGEGEGDGERFGEDDDNFGED